MDGCRIGQLVASEIATMSKKKDLIRQAGGQDCSNNVGGFGWLLVVHNDITTLFSRKKLFSRKFSLHWVFYSFYAAMSHKSNPAWA